MKKFCLSNLQYLLLALLMAALTGCGANHSVGPVGAAADGGVTARLVWGASKGAAKSAALVTVPSNVTSVQFTVTGTGPSGRLPVVRSTVSTTGGTVSGIYPGTVTVAAKALDSTGAVLFEGFALNTVITSGVTTTIANPIVMSPPVEKTQDKPCIACHETTLDATGQNLVAEFKQSGHYTNQSWTDNPKNGITGTGCAGCHGPSHNDGNPSASGRCAECHVPTVTDAHHAAKYLVGSANNTCSKCHNSHNPLGPFVGGSCVACHAFAQDKTAHGNYVNDNNGVRAITTEFSKWSHHVTGVALNDAHCAACHLEGVIKDGAVVIDTTKHMADAKTHLRNADNDADFAWDPAAPDHSGMDNYCMSCHDANGAASPMSAQIQNYINTKGLAAAGKSASASNPFGDTISNRYDKMQRPAVVDASSQFDTGNNSHHAVKGQRYTKRTRIANAGDPRAMTAGQSAAFAANSSALLKGKRSTMYDSKVLLVASGNFTSVLNQLYVPLENAAGETFPRTGSDTLGDDSTLHCGDCHTVGQWKVGSSVNALGQPTTAAIGAHGSNNEYLLRNSIGTDERHTQNAYTIAANVVTFTNPNGAFLVCYNCHTYAQYGSVYNATGIVGPHAGEYDQAGRCDGIGNTLPFNGYTTGTATDGTQFASRFEGPVTKYSSAAPYAGEQNPDFGNIFGIQCLNCHNSGLGNGYGGIHGSAKNTTTSTQVPNASVTGGAYIDGMGNTTKIERFLPGLGDAMHVPGTLGGFIGGVNVFKNGSTASGGTYVTGGISNDTNWEQKHWQQTASTSFGPTGTGPVSGTLTSAGAGCYTLSESATAATSTLVGPSVTGAGGPATEGIGVWGGCDDHGAAQGKGDHGFIKRIVRPVTY